MNQQYLNNNKFHLCTCAIAVSLALTSQQSLSQTANQLQNTQSQSANNQPIESIVVTGSRLKSANQQSASPITSIDAEQLKYSGKINLQEIVMEIGALAGSTGEDETSNGEHYLNLRNLGTNRTLTLVDGQRFVSGAGNGSASVDTNSIPLAMIERVEVLTGGTSAIYGADAVTGVVNFVLKDNFSGFAFDSQYSDAFDGDFTSQQYSFTLGENLADDNANITLSYTYGYQPTVMDSARYAASKGLYERINNPNGDTPQYILAQGTNEAFFSQHGARIDPLGAFSDGFNGDGSPFEHGVNVGSFAGTGEIGGDGMPNYLLFSNGLRPGNKRHVFTLKSHYNFNDDTRVFANINYSDVSSYSANQQSLTVGNQVKRDNAFLPQSILDAAPSDTTSILFNRWDLDAGFRATHADKHTYRIVLGAKGDFGESSSYEVSANFGQTKRQETIENNRLFDRYQAAIDSVFDQNGNIVCRSTLDASSFNTINGDFLATSFDPSQGPLSFSAGANSPCIPFNPFTQKSINQAAIDWIWQPTISDTTNKQQIFTAFIRTDSSDFVEINQQAIDLILGFEHRKEQTDTRFDYLSQADLGIAQISGSDLAGEFDVSEFFTEASIPLVSDTSYAKSIDLELAYRFSDYSTIGKTDTYKSALKYAVNDQIKFRATYSSAVRAPNLGELFTPQRAISTSLGEDPCHIDNVNLGSDTRKTNCATALNAIGVNPDTFAPLLGTFFPGLSGGSPDLKEETSITHTLGAMWQPSHFDGLNVSLDYFDITIDDAVVSPRQVDIFNACYDAASLDNVFCDLIGRDSSTGAANFVELQSVNVARIETSGFELLTSYRFNTAKNGTFGFNLNATYLERLMLQKTTEPGLTDDKGLFNTDTGGSSPQWVTNFSANWQYRDWDINYRFNYQSKTLRPPLTNEQRQDAYDIIDFPYVKAFVNHDVQLGYYFDDNIKLSLGIRNLTDEYPDKTRASLNGPSGRQGYAGRSFYLGLNLNFE